MPMIKCNKICFLSFVLAFVAFCFPCRVMSAWPMGLENRLSQCSAVMREIMEAPDASIPSDLLRKSRAIIILPTVIKVGFGLGGHYGKGAVLRRDPGTGKWGPPAFLKLLGGSLGWQVGVQSTDMVLLVMNEVSLRSLFKDRFTLGVDGSVAVGPVGRDASAATDLGLSAGILSYSRAKGIFAGVSIKGSMLEVDWDANESYYGSDVSIIDIFFNAKGAVSPAAIKLISLLNRYSSRHGSREGSQDSH
jgi:lipid-binding SYLF domain-containing protein